GDIVSVTLTSGAICAIPPTVSNTMVMTVLPQEMPTVDVAAIPGLMVCQGAVVTFAATPTNGGTSPTYLWLRNGLHVGTSSTYTYVPANGDIVYCMMSSSYACRLMNTVS